MPDQNKEAILAYITLELKVLKCQLTIEEKEKQVEIITSLGLSREEILERGKEFLLS